ncbi:type 1 fimbrial protein [Pantoea vagans]|uniref:type 1 fimbrial protein n=1 Tax=Pantoea vagans TaxID=470934 RepID=UPI00050DA989|nr:type 1 fimbrial protein [Pantoea vagans]KGD71085.1 hypothetical protein ID11_19535 [Pantoea vagans]
MKSFISICFTMLLICMAGPVSADLNSGVVSFRGAIVNDSCNINTVNMSVVFNCYDPASGRSVAASANLMNSDSLEALPAEVKMHWYNPEKTKGVIYVAYL